MDEPMNCQAAAIAQSEPITPPLPPPSLLARLQPLNRLPYSQLGQLLVSARMRDLARQEPISGWVFRNWYVYVLQGEVLLRGKRFRREWVRADTARARQPVFDSPTATGLATTACRLLQVDRMRFDQLRRTRPTVEVQEESPAESERLIRQLFAGR